MSAASASAFLYMNDLELAFSHFFATTFASTHFNSRLLALFCNSLCVSWRVEACGGPSTDRRGKPRATSPAAAAPRTARRAARRGALAANSAALATARRRRALDARKNNLFSTEERNSTTENYVYTI